MRKTPARTPAATTPAASARPSITGGRLGRPSPPSPSSYYSSYYTAGYFEERPSILALYLVIFLTTLIIGGLVTALFFAYARELAHPRVTKATTTKTTTNNTRAQAQTSVASALPTSTAKSMRPARRGNVEVTSNSPPPKASKRSSKNRRKSTSSKRAKQNATTAAERARRRKGMTTAFHGSDRPLDKSAANRIGQDAETGPTERSSGIMPVQLTADTSGTIDTTFSAPGPAPVTTTPLEKWAGLLHSVPTADETNATGPSLSYNPDQVDGGRDLISSTFSVPDSAPVATTPLGKWSDLDYVLPVDGANATGASLNYDPDEIAGGHDIDSTSTTFSAPSPPAASEVAVTPFEEWGGLNGDEIGVNETSAEGSVLVGQMG